MTDSGYNQVLVMIDHSGHLINTWKARHGCPMTFQSDNGAVFEGELIKALMRHSEVAQADSTSYHPQNNYILSRQIRNRCRF